MRVSSRVVALAFSVWLVGLPATVFAQNSQWADPYQKALKAISAKQYQEAVTLLQQAIAVEPKASANKYVEGVFRIDYFPYYYLGVAYFELHQFQLARVNFGKAHAGLPRSLEAQLNTYEKRLSVATTAAPLASATQVGSSPSTSVRPAPTGDKPAATNPAATDKRPTNPTASTERPAINPKFEAAVQAANTALAARRFADAVASFDAAKSVDAAEYGKENLQPMRDRAAQTLVTGQQLGTDGLQLLAANHLKAAREKLQQADQMVPGQQTIADGLSRIRQREETYQRLKASATVGAHVNIESALGELAQARAADPDLFAADKLGARVLALQQILSDKAAFKKALLALLQGDPRRSATLLESALRGRPDNTMAAPLHAYLGVAYATQALSSSAQDGNDARELHSKAVAEFRLAMTAESNYRLSDRIVSPKIVALFDSARQ